MGVADLLEGYYFIDYADKARVMHELISRRVNKRNYSDPQEKRKCIKTYANKLIDFFERENTYESRQEKKALLKRLNLYYPGLMPN